MKKIKILLIAIAVLFIIPTPVYMAKITQNYAKIVMLTDPGKGGGTGFHIVVPSGKTFILTNAHVCRNAKSMVVGYDKKRWVREVVEVSNKYDLCLLNPTFDDGVSMMANPTSFLPHMAAGYGALSPLTISVGTYVESIYTDLCLDAQLFRCLKWVNWLLNGGNV